MKRQSRSPCLKAQKIYIQISINRAFCIAFSLSLEGNSAAPSRCLRHCSTSAGMGKHLGWRWTIPERNIDTVKGKYGKIIKLNGGLSIAMFDSQRLSQSFWAFPLVFPLLFVKSLYITMKTTNNCLHLLFDLFGTQKPGFPWVSHWPSPVLPPRVPGARDVFSLRCTTPALPKRRYRVLSTATPAWRWNQVARGHSPCGDACYILVPFFSPAWIPVALWLLKIICIYLLLSYST